MSEDAPKKYRLLEDRIKRSDVSLEQFWTWRDKLFWFWFGQCLKRCTLKWVQAVEFEKRKNVFEHQKMLRKNIASLQSCRMRCFFEAILVIFWFWFEQYFKRYPPQRDLLGFHLFIGTLIFCGVHEACQFTYEEKIHQAEFEKKKSIRKCYEKTSQN